MVSKPNEILNLDDFLPDLCSSDDIDTELGHLGIPDHLWDFMLTSFGSKQCFTEHLSDMRDIQKYTASQETQLAAFIANVQNEKVKIVKRVDFVKAKYSSCSQPTVKELWLRFCFFYQSQIHAYDHLLQSLFFLTSQVKTIVDPNIKELVDLMDNSPSSNSPT